MITVTVKSTLVMVFFFVATMALLYGDMLRLAQ
jgi:hypothetical protein